jgi:hypothetical protein
VFPPANRILEAGASESGKGFAMRFGPFLAIALLLFIVWIGGFLVFHVASALIHLLLLVAIVSLVVHFFTGSARTI